MGDLSRRLKSVGDFLFGTGLLFALRVHFNFELGGEHGEPFFGFWREVFESREIPQRGDVAAVVTGIVDRRFENEGAA